MTGVAAFSPAVRAAVLESTGGYCVGGCGRRASQVHHRCPRRMGGTSIIDVGAAPNGLPVCDSLHAWIETCRDHAARLGWLLHEPANVPFWSEPWGCWMVWILAPDTDPGTWLVAPADHAPGRPVGFRHDEHGTHLIGVPDSDDEFGTAPLPLA